VGFSNQGSRYYVTEIVSDLLKLVEELTLKNKQRREATRSKLSAEGKATFDDCEELAERAVRLIGKRNSLAWHIEKVESMLPDASQEDLARANEKLNEWRSKLANLQIEVERARQELIDAELGMARHLIESELAGLANEHRQLGERLVRRRNRERGYLYRRIDAGKLGESFGRVFGLEIRLDEADKRDDISRSKHYSESLIKARPTMEKCFAEYERLEAEQEAVDTRYERWLGRLRSL